MVTSFAKRLRQIHESTPAFSDLMLADSSLLASELSYLVILPWWITNQRGPGALAFYSATIAVAAFITGPLAAPYGDRLCKAAQIVWGVLAMLVTALVQAAMAHSETFSLPLLTGLGSVQAAARAFVDPARSTLLTELVPPKQLPEGIRLRKAAHAVSGTAGPLVSGLALSTLGLLGAFSLYGGLLATALVSASRLPRQRRIATQRGGLRRWWGEVVLGMRAKWNIKLERGWTIVNFVMWLFQGPAVGLLIPVKVQSLGLSSNWLGMAVGALAGGVFLGSIVGAQGLAKQFGRFRVRLAVGLCEGAVLALVGLAESPYLMLIALGAGGFCNACLSLIGSTHRALAIPQDFRVRMFAAGAMSTQIASALGPVLVGLGLTRWTVREVYSVCGLLTGMSVLGFLLVPRYKEFLSLDHDQLVDWYLVQHPEVFSPEGTGPGGEDNG